MSTAALLLHCALLAQAPAESPPQAADPPSYRREQTVPGKSGPAQPGDPRPAADGRPPGMLLPPAPDDARGGVLPRYALPDSNRQPEGQDAARAIGRPAPVQPGSLQAGEVQAQHLAPQGGGLRYADPPLRSSFGSQTRQPSERQAQPTGQSGGVAAGSSDGTTPSSPGSGAAQRPPADPLQGQRTMTGSFLRGVTGSSSRQLEGEAAGTAPAGSPAGSRSDQAERSEAALEKQRTMTGGFLRGITDAAEASRAGEGSTLVPVDAPQRHSQAERVLTRLLTPPEKAALSGQRVTLRRALPEHESLASAHVETLVDYWRLSRSLAEYHRALAHQRRLNSLATDFGIRDPLLDVALLRATAEMQGSRLQAVEAQYQLQSRLGAGGTSSQSASPEQSDSLPLPLERPIVVPYRTLYDSIFSGRPSSDSARHEATMRARTLPLAHATIEAYAAAVDAAASRATAMHAALIEGKADGRALITAWLELNELERSFLAAVYDYNHSIARYARLAAPPGSRAATLLPMVQKIRPPVPQSAALESQIGPSSTTVADNAFTSGAAIQPNSAGDDRAQMAASGADLAAEPGATVAKDGPQQAVPIPAAALPSAGAALASGVAEQAPRSEPGPDAPQALGGELTDSAQPIREKPPLRSVLVRRGRLEP